MATLIICPACGTRYEIKAAFPPEGRKVRCAKCSHVWMAKPAGAEALAPAPEAAPAQAPQGQAPQPPQPPAPPQAPAAPAPQAAPQPQAPVPPPMAPQAAPPPPRAPEPPPPPPPQAAPPPPPPPPQAPPPPEAPLTGMAPAQRSDAEYEAEDALTAQMARLNAEAAPPPPPPPPEPAPTVAKQGGLFAKIMGKRTKPPAEGPPEMAPPPPPEMAPPPPPEMPPPPPSDATFGEAAPRGESAYADASFDAGYAEGETPDPALADPELVAAAFGEAPPKAKAPRKPLPIVAIGWGVLALLVAIVVGLFALAPGTTVSMLPGAAKVYSLLGMPVGADGLAFEGVRYGWTNDGSQTVLEVQGNVKNTSGSTMTVPTVVIALRDEKGEEISEWTTEVGSAELAAGEEAPFLRQIPSPPSNVRSLKVRFAKAD